MMNKECLKSVNILQEHKTYKDVKILTITPFFFFFEIQKDQTKYF